MSEFTDDADPVLLTSCAHDHAASVRAAQAVVRLELDETLQTQRLRALSGLNPLAPRESTSVVP